jgi:hypothetical protein
MRDQSTFCPAVPAGSYLSGQCGECRSERLGWVDIDTSGSLYLRCLECDTPLAEPYFPASEQDLKDLGWAEIETGASGCGVPRSPCRGCGCSQPAASHSRRDVLGR